MKDTRVYLLHIRDAVVQIGSYTKGGREEFFNNKCPLPSHISYLTSTIYSLSSVL